MFSPTNGFDGPDQKPARGAISLLARLWTFGNHAWSPGKGWATMGFVDFNEFF